MSESTLKVTTFLVKIILTESNRTRFVFCCCVFPFYYVTICVACLNI